MNTFDPIRVDFGKVRVVLDWIGEGYNGDYQENDPDDKPLLRFDVYRFYEPNEEITPYFLDDETPGGGWLPVRDGSYCTQLVATEPRETLQTMAQFILDQVKGDISCQQRCKRLMEELSWLKTTAPNPNDPDGLWPLVI